MVKHARDALLAAAVQVARDQGLRQLSFGRVAAQAGTNDRTVVYYFPSKDVLVTDVLLALSRDLEARLGAVGSRPLPSAEELLGEAWPVLASPEADPVFALFFEASGLAAARVAPYDALVPALVQAWVDWAEVRLLGAPAARRAEAEAAVALLDGLLMFRQVMGPDAADRAARRLRSRAGPRS